MSDIIFKDGYIYLKDEDGNTVNCTRECVEATRDYMLSVCEDIKKPFAGLVWELNGVGEITLAVFSTNKYSIEEKVDK
jgi:hypothetical protein